MQKAARILMMRGRAAFVFYAFFLDTFLIWS